MQSLEGHGASVFTVAWHPDGSRIATGGWDLTVRIWDPLSGSEICCFEKPAGIVQMLYDVAWNPDGRRLAVSDIEGRVGILDSSPGWIAENQHDAPRPPSVSPETAANELRRSLQYYCQVGEPHAKSDPDALRRLALILATAPFDEVRDGPKALQLATQANQLTGGRNPGVLSILASAHAECGDFAKAITTQQLAISLITSDESRTRHAAVLKLYQSGQPLRNYSW